MRNSVVLLTGAAGSGKTHSKEVISDRPPPDCRDSTALSEDPITFSVVSTTEGDWEIMDGERQADMLTSAMASSAALKASEETVAGASPLQLSSSTSLVDGMEEQADLVTLATASSVSSKHRSPPHLSTTQLAPASISEVGQTDYVTHSTQHELLSLHRCRKTEVSEKSHTVETEFIGRLGKTSKQLYNHDLVYLFDTGGQPAFHAILPLFFPIVMLIICVLKLSEKLSQHPKIYYFVKGECIGTPYISPLSHLEIMQHSFSAIQSQMIVQDCIDKGFPKMMIVATHRDKEWRCGEGVREKKRKLAEILSPSLKEHLVYHSARKDDLIFALNAKDPKQKDQQMATNIRKAIIEATSKIESKKTPLSWHILELALRQLAISSGRGFLTRVECIAEACKLRTADHVLDAALDHFCKLNVILYYRQVLPHLVFIQAQPLMEKISELIQKMHALRGQVHNMRTPIDGKWLKFRDQGIITLDILKKFPHGYVEGVFSPHDLLKLMQHKLLVSPIDQTSYFMPCLLPNLDTEGLSVHRTQPDSTIAPVSILFPSGVVPTGLFCSLVSSLLSADSSPQLHLKTSPSDRSCVECVAFNCIKFSMPNNSGSLVLINAYTHLELHLNAPYVEQPATLCAFLKEKILTSIHVAAHVLSYHKLECEFAFLCETDTSHAMVKVTPDSFWLRRMMLGDPRQVDVAPATHPARISGRCGWMCSLDPDHVHGKLQERHTVWLKEPHPSEFPSSENV